MKTMKQYASYRQLWQALLPYYDEREAQAVVRMMLEERFGLTLTDIVCGGVALLLNVPLRCRCSQSVWCWAWKVGIPVPGERIAAVLPLLLRSAVS